jgi:hypothetical protein
MKKEIAVRLLRLAKQLMAADPKKAEWSPVRKDVDVGMRNKMMLQSLTSFAPALGKEMKKRMSVSLKKQGYDVRPNDLKREWSQYLGYIDESNNNNKYHYYAVYSFDTADGTLYLAGNCSGRIGIVERAYDLTLKYGGGPSTSERGAVSAAEKHLKPKLRKGYEKVRMTRG